MASNRSPLTIKGTITAGIDGHAAIEIATFEVTIRIDAVTPGGPVVLVEGADMYGLKSDIADALAEAAEQLRT